MENNDRHQLFSELKLPIIDSYSSPGVTWLNREQIIITRAVVVKEMVLSKWCWLFDTVWTMSFSIKWLVLIRGAQKFSKFNEMREYYLICIIPSFERFRNFFYKNTGEFHFSPCINLPAGNVIYIQTDFISSTVFVDKCVIFPQELPLEKNTLFDLFTQSWLFKVEFFMNRWPL